MKKYFRIALAILLVLGVGLLDYVTKAQIALGILYFVPIAFAAWKISRMTALLMAALALGTWAAVDGLSLAAYTSPWVTLWNASARGLSFVLIALLVSALCEQREKQTAINERLRKSIEETEKSAARIRELQNELQLICSWTNRIRSEGKWMRFEEFMQKNFHMKFTHGISEEAIQKMGDDFTMSLPEAESSTKGQ